VGTGVAVWLGLTGKTRWTGRSLTLLDPTYASKFVPIVASVAEHQSPVWTSFLFDLHITVLFSSVGLWLCFSRPNETTIFMGLYGVISSYFACMFYF
jgi:dolichyl-diphosphooligosaccharide---protein glycosyltransferase